jgi:protein-S-isoprenylcysteine O-methyltransferase Ste14
MFLRALFAFLVLPGVFAGLIPAWIVLSDSRRGNGSPIGMLPMAVGGLLLLWCVRDFYVAGKGTLAPWDPPKRLVVVGLYRFVRNPMYVSILILLVGWTIATGSPSLAVYTVILAIAFHLRVILHEEPRLTKLFGPDWTAYKTSVPRWFPRRVARGGDRRGS